MNAAEIQGNRNGLHINHINFSTGTGLGKGDQTLDTSARMQKRASILDTPCRQQTQLKYGEESLWAQAKS